MILDMTTIRTKTHRTLRNSDDEQSLLFPLTFSIYFFKLHDIWCDALFLSLVHTQNKSSVAVVLLLIGFHSRRRCEGTLKDIHTDIVLLAFLFGFCVEPSCHHHRRRRRCYCRRRRRRIYTYFAIFILAFFFFRHISFGSPLNGTHHGISETALSSYMHIIYVNNNIIYLNLKLKIQTRNVILL